MDEIIKIKEDKKQERGGFSKKLKLLSVEWIEESVKWIEESVECWALSEQLVTFMKYTN
jgi:hypothetical protein